MSDLSEILEGAASSPDPRVRGMALRLKNIDAEREALVMFFTLYASEKGLAAPVAKLPVKVQPAPKERTNGAVNGRGRRPNGEDAFGGRIRTLLTGGGATMRLNDMFEAYSSSYPDDQTNLNNFRQRIMKRRDQLQLVNGREYWPADIELPAGTATSDEPIHESAGD